VLVWKATTAEMNPRIDPAIIAEAYEDDPESAASEYGAEFRTDIADFIGRQVVDACVEVGCPERPPAASRRAPVFGLHRCRRWLGVRQHDTLGIAHLEKDGVPVLDAIRERNPPFSPEDVVAEFVALMKSYGHPQGRKRQMGRRLGWARRFAEHNYWLGHEGCKARPPTIMSGSSTNWTAC
jgi:hypothetical protein